MTGRTHTEVMALATTAINMKKEEEQAELAGMRLANGASVQRHLNNGKRTT